MSQQEAGLPPGMRLRDRYIIEGIIGQGGFGRTYRAKDTGRFNELVAIKELTPITQVTAELQKAEELFEREAAILYKLNHTQIPRFWEFFRQGKQLFLVQDYIEGETYESLLNARLQQGNCFSEAEIIELFRRLLPVLSYLHHQGVVHRDISPDNIMRRAKDGLPILIDMGGVKQVAMNVAYQLTSGNNKFNSANTRLGKQGYAPDEQMRMGIVAPYSDLYALGVTAVVLMTGKQPQDLIDSQTMNWIWEKQISLSYPLKRIINRMLANQPAKRFQSADEILKLLEYSTFSLFQNHPLSPSGMQTLAGQNLPQRIRSQLKTLATNNSGQGSFLDDSAPVPDEIKGWNWGAFFLPGFWCLPNKVWVGLFAWTDPTIVLTAGMPWLIMGVILGAKGNEWAWKARKWSSVAAFKTHQKAWAIASFLLVGIILFFLLAIIGFIVILWMASFGR